MGPNRVITVLIILSAICTANAFNHLTPWDKEVIYHWEALVKAGTDLPTSYASQFVLEGKIHLQSNNNATHVKITDLTYKLYNGILDHVHEHEAHSVPMQVPELEQVFKVVYDTNGLAVGIVTESQDKEFSRNIKKAIATVLQMDDSVMKQVHPQRHHPYSFMLKEHSIYGQFNVDYTVHRLQNGDIVVHKLHDMHDSYHLYQNLVSNNEQCPCDLGYENPLLHESRKNYVIVEQDDHHFVKEIKTVGALIYQPFKAQSDHQFVFVNQTFQFMDVVPIQQQFHIQTEHFENHLTYHFFTDSVDGSIHDVTNGRHVVDYDKLIPTVQHMLEDISQYLHENHIHMQEPNTKQGQLVNRVQRLLQMFSLSKLHEFHKKLAGETLNVFHHLLPLVGTKASVFFIKHLVVNKIVNDEVAIEMLQHFPEHVIEPTMDLLSQMEELMHLGDNIQWNVRKCGILGFATLIHKSHVFTEKIHRNNEYDHHVPHNDHSYDHQEPYEKYVTEYANKFKSSGDYKVQMTYALALCNMKLHSIIQHMLPAVNGEWQNDYHFRLLSLWAMGSSAVYDKDPKTMMETIWPVFTDVTEITEMRLHAFYHLMKHQLTDSMLMNMREYLLNETNDEVYSFAYTYLYDIMESNEPCNQEYRVKVAHLVKMLPPPTHGKSFLHIQNYKDMTYGFSEGMYEFFGKGDNALMFGLVTTSQQFNILHEDYVVYFKIHGMQQHGDPINMLFDLFRKKIPKMLTNSKDVHIECVISSHGHVTNTYFFDKQNLHELDNILNFFTKDSHSVIQDMCHVSYNEYHRVVIPTDLGIPSVWEYLMPVVHHGNFTVTKETVNKVVNVHVNSRYVNWAHYRHGLSFYNSMADVWQGINRYHSYDEVWPLRFDVTLNTQQQSMQVSWKKPSNVQQAVGGLRSHVKQMVFVKDDHNGNVLMQSSPQCKEFVIVTHGKQFRNDYALMHDDDLSTGHRWECGVYDSSRYITNGSFQHLMHLFTQSHLTDKEAPLGHFLMTYSNWRQYVRLLPKPGMYGFFMKVEPSHLHSVSNIDMSLRLHSESANDESYYYCPKTKWSTRMTYSVKNKEKSLKTWDVNAIIDMNPGHTINNLKMHLTRIVPGQKDYKICVEGVKKWSPTGVEGHVNIAMSQTSDGRCIKDDTVIDVTMKGEASQEQMQGKHKYGSCEYISPYSVPHKHSLDCLADHTTARHYVYNVKTTNVPSEFRKTAAYWWDTVKGYYMTYYSYEDEHNDKIADHNLKIDVTYPMQEEQVNVHMTTPQHVFKLTGMPTYYWKWFGISPDSIEYPKWFQYLHHIGFVDHCIIEVDHYQFNKQEVREKVPDEWTLYVGNSVQNPQMAVYVKHANDKIAVKIVENQHTVEIVPHGANHQITVDGQVVSVTQYYHKDWIFCHVFIQDSHQPVAVMFQNSGIHIEYDQNHVAVVVPVMEQLQGRCYSHH